MENMCQTLLREIICELIDKSVDRKLINNNFDNEKYSENNVSRSICVILYIFAVAHDLMLSFSQLN